MPKLDPAHPKTENPPSYQLLLLFRTLYEEKNPGLAAARLQIPSSTASRRLSELREYFEDPLFTRYIEGLVPTRRATELLPGVEQVLGDYAALREAPCRK